MVFDGLSAALLTPALAREGWTLADLASSLRAAVGGYERVHLKQLKRDAEAADFVVGEGDARTVLHVPGVDAFSDPRDSLPLRGVPPMWGSVLRIDGRYEFRPNAIRCHADVLAMPSRLTGRFLVTGHPLPETVRMAAVGHPLSRVIAIDPATPLDFRIKDIRDARDEDFKRVSHSGQYVAATIGAAPPAPVAPQGMVIAVEAGDVVSIDFD